MDEDSGSEFFFQIPYRDFLRGFLISQHIDLPLMEY